MTRPDQDYSRLNRNNRRNKANTILNVLIGVVVLLIIVTASTIFINGKSKQTDGDKNSQEIIDDNKSDDIALDEDVSDEGATNDPNEESSDNSSGNGNDSEDANIDKNDGSTDVESSDSGIITYESTDEEIIERTIVDTSWQAIGTEQTGEHVSVYDKESVDWKEKQEALAYATGLQVNSMIFWKIKNGGSPQKSIGIVSNLDKSEMYQVYIEWENERGWKPMKVDVLNTLDFDY